VIRRKACAAPFTARERFREVKEDNASRSARPRRGPQMAARCAAMPLVTTAKN